MADLDLSNAISVGDDSWCPFCTDNYKCRLGGSTAGYEIDQGAEHIHCEGIHSDPKPDNCPLKQGLIYTIFWGELFKND